ncbi:MAG TPA: hypothetical protein VN767_14555 [Streptosporangiaceae bacterium]|jgi:hypothetical protein|nr:hypothetical protein [Streptosporangiaceae bacterium]
MTAAEPATASGRAERVIVISLVKSGTHLIQELMVALGYGMYGHSRITDEIKPRLDQDTRWRIARMIYDEPMLKLLGETSDESFRKTTDEAWEAYAMAWQMKFGMPLVNRYGAELPSAELIERARSRTVATDFSDTPSGVCWIFIEFDVKRIDGRFLREWSQTGEPRIIFNYRDPRDIVLSMINFLTGKTGNGIGNFSEFQIFSRILDSMPTLDAQLTYALSDPSFPTQGDLGRMFWLLSHPNVCKVSFEELIGAQGGGSEERQREAVTRIADFLGVRTEVETVLPRLYNRNSFSFFKGQSHAWRDVFTPYHRQLAERRFGEMLALYGYR